MAAGAPKAPVVAEAHDVDTFRKFSEAPFCSFVRNGGLEAPYPLGQTKLEQWSKTRR